MQFGFALVAALFGFYAMAGAQSPPSTPLLWQPPSSNCDSGHNLSWLDGNLCSSWAQSFNTNYDPSIIVTIEVAGTPGPVGASQYLTFTFGSGPCSQVNSGCTVGYTFIAEDNLANIACQLVAAIKASPALYNPSAANTSQQGQVINATCVNSRQISMDLNGDYPTRINVGSFGGSQVNLAIPNDCSATTCDLILDTGTFRMWSMSPGFVPAIGSSIKQDFFTAPSTGGNGVYGQETWKVVDPAVSLGDLFVSGNWDGVLSGIHVSRGLYSVSNSDGGPDTATFNQFIGNGTAPFMAPNMSRDGAVGGNLMCVSQIGRLYVGTQTSC